MHTLLQRFLKKKGIESLEELTEEEKQTFDQYDAILSKKDLTIDELKIFIHQQIGIIEAKWADYSLDEFKKAELIPYHTVYKAILRALSAPDTERSNLEKKLETL